MKASGGAVSQLENLISAWTLLFPAHLWRSYSAYLWFFILVLRTPVWVPLNPPLTGVIYAEFHSTESLPRSVSGINPAAAALWHSCSPFKGPVTIPETVLWGNYTSVFSSGSHLKMLFFSHTKVSFTITYNLWHSKFEQTDRFSKR